MFLQCKRKSRSGDCTDALNFSCPLVSRATCTARYRSRVIDIYGYRLGTASRKLRHGWDSCRASLGSRASTRVHRMHTGRAVPLPLWGGKKLMRVRVHPRQWFFTRRKVNDYPSLYLVLHEDKKKLWQMNGLEQFFFFFTTCLYR